MNCFNGEKYLREAIESVIGQTYEHWEIVFWDNQSTDKSAEIFRSYGDPRLKYFYAPAHTMLYEARNSAIENARGELLAFLDVDDWWTSDKLARQVPLFEDPEVGIACGNYWIESERKNKRWKALKTPAPTGRVLDDLLKSYFVGLPTLMVRRAALESLGRACDPRYHIMGDYDLVVRLAVSWKLACIQEPVAHYRLHDSNESAKHRGRLVEEMGTWLDDMRAVEGIRRSPNFGVPENLHRYWNGIHSALSGNRRAAFRATRMLPWGRLKLRLLAAVLLPGAIARRLTK